MFIAEDDQHFCELYQMALGIEGYNVLCAYNGKDALEKIPGEAPDLIILDVVMPEMTGLEVCRRLRELPDFALTPIIMLTALATDDDKMIGICFLGVATKNRRILETATGQPAP